MCKAIRHTANLCRNVGLGKDLGSNLLVPHLSFDTLHGVLNKLDWVKQFTIDDNKTLISKGQ